MYSKQRVKLYCNLSHILNNMGRVTISMSGVQRPDSDKLREVDVTKLKRGGVEELDELYLRAKVPHVRDLEGVYGVSLLAGNIPLMPGKLAKFANPPLDAWSKKFKTYSDGTSNVINRFDVGVKRKEYIAEGRVGRALYGKGCYVCDYDVVRNPSPVRGLRDEIRKIGNGLYLGRLYFTNEGYNRFLTYFALEKE